MEKISLKEYFEKILKELDIRYEQRFQAQKEAITKAETSFDYRIGLLNELRGGVATKDQLEALKQHLDELKGRLDRQDGRSTGFKEGWGILVGIAVVSGSVVGILSHFLLK